jgi:hypothetical protein
MKRGPMCALEQLSERQRQTENIQDTHNPNENTVLVSTGGWWHLNWGERAPDNDWSGSSGMVSNTLNTWFPGVWCHSISSVPAIIMSRPPLSSLLCWRVETKVPGKKSRQRRSVASACLCMSSDSSPVDIPPSLEKNDKNCPWPLFNNKTQ